MIVISTQCCKSKISNVNNDCSCMPHAGLKRSRIALFFAIVIFSLHLICLLWCLWRGFTQIPYNRSATSLLKRLLPRRSFKLNDEYYAAISSDDNPVYLFSAPLAVLSWAQLNISSVVILIGNEKIFRSNPLFRVSIELIEKFGAKIVFINSALAPKHTLAQMSRLFIAGSPTLSMISDDSILITTDADMLTLTLKDHIPKRRRSCVFIYNSNCCGSKRYENSSREYKQFPIHSIAMSARLWRDIMGIDRNWLSNGDIMARRLYDELGEQLIRNGGGKGSKLWFADQMLISKNIDRWLRRNSSGEVCVEEFTGPLRRIDRAWWDVYNFSRINMTLYDDVHLVQPLYSKSNWIRTLPLLMRIFDEPIMQTLHVYHHSFTQQLPFNN